MLSAYQQPVRGDSGTFFTEALAQDEISANYDLILPAKTSSWFIRGFTLVAVQNLNYELWVFDSATNLSATDVDADHLVGIWQFFGPIAAQAPGYTVTPAAGGGANPYFRYYVDGNLIPYFDRDQMVTPSTTGVAGGIAANQVPQGPKNAKLHMRLINRSATGKNAGATGAVALTAWCATQGMQV